MSEWAEGTLIFCLLLFIIHIQHDWHAVLVAHGHCQLQHDGHALIIRCLFNLYYFGCAQLLRWDFYAAQGAIGEEPDALVSAMYYACAKASAAIALAPCIVAISSFVFSFVSIIRVSPPPHHSPLSWSWTPEAWEWDQMNITDPLVQAAVADSRAMQTAWETVAPPFALASCGWVLGPLGARWYYDSVLPASWTMSSIDEDLGNTPVDPSYNNLTHRTADKKWAIPWAEDDPGLTAPELWVGRSLDHARAAANYSVGGLLSIHWRTRATSPQSECDSACFGRVVGRASFFFLFF